jgi:sugar phosphate isomerase/epimerase
MILGISNLAWEKQENLQVFRELQKLGITHIEGVPSKIADWSELTTDTIRQYKQELTYQKINITSMQSIFYKVECSGIDEVEVILAHFTKLISYSKILGVHILVFGSPQLRKVTESSNSSLVQIFTKLDSILDNTGITVVIEPNAKIYGGQFFNTVEEIVLFIQNNKLRNIRTMVDTHNILLEGQNPLVVFSKYFSYIKHIHISEVNLQPIANQEFHKNFANTLKSSTYAGGVTYELLPCKELAKELKTFIEIYKK